MKLNDKKQIEKKFCPKCKKEKPINKFYQSTSLLFPDGVCNICSDCFIQSIDINDIESVKDGLMKLDKPFLSSVWAVSSTKEGVHPFRDYIRMLNSLKQYHGLKWKDGERVNTQEETKVQIQEKKKEDLIYSTEWVGYYTQSDLDYLEEYLESLKNDFKIVTRNHKDYARKIAKASLAMDKAYEEMIGGTGGEKKYKDMKEIFDTLSKSAQFSESERGINDVSLGCFGVVFDKVEKKMWIPEHQPTDKDMYDSLLEQFSNINKSL